MVEVFRTNVDNENAARELTRVLSSVFPLGRVNFDLDDCDRILRIEHASVCVESVLFIMRSNGFSCEVLPG